MLLFRRDKWSRTLSLIVICPSFSLLIQKPYRISSRLATSTEISNYWLVIEEIWLGRPTGWRDMTKKCWNKRKTSNKQTNKQISIQHNLEIEQNRTKKLINWFVHCTWYIIIHTKQYTLYIFTSHVINGVIIEIQFEKKNCLCLLYFIYVFMFYKLVQNSGYFILQPQISDWGFL